MEQQPKEVTEFYKAARLAKLGEVAVDVCVVQQLEAAVEAGQLSVDEAAARYAAYVAARNP